MATKKTAKKKATKKKAVKKAELSEYAKSQLRMRESHDQLHDKQARLGGK